MSPDYHSEYSQQKIYKFLVFFLLKNCRIRPKILRDFKRKISAICVIFVVFRFLNGKSQEIRMCSTVSLVTLADSNSHEQWWTLTWTVLELFNLFLGYAFKDFLGYAKNLEFIDTFIIVFFVIFCFLFLFFFFSFFLC